MSEEQRPVDINEARPSSVNHLIGQPSVREQIVVALDSAQQDNRKFDSARRLRKCQNLLMKILQC
jgi:Holliday junction resolvasome RuvABC ATP-dependent DNA helicase subunit